MGLAKDFTKAAVNQVGRDTGKVISNTLFGDKHATPIRHVNSRFYKNNSSDDNAEISYEEATELLEIDGFKPNLKIAKMWLVILIFIFTYGMFVISPIIYITKGILKINRKKTVYFKNMTVPTYTQDARYKTGKRHTGYANEKVELTMPANEDEIRIYKKRGMLYIALGIIQAIIQISIIIISTTAQ